MPLECGWAQGQREDSTYKNSSLVKIIKWVYTYLKGTCNPSQSENRCVWIFFFLKCDNNIRAERTRSTPEGRKMRQRSMKIA